MADYSTPIHVDQYFTLKSLFRCIGCMPPVVLLWGPSSSGKTYTLNAALRDTGVERIICVSAKEILCGRKVFVQTLIDESSDHTSDYKLQINTTEVKYLVKSLVDIFPRHATDRYIIIIDGIEKMMKEHSDILESFCRLHEFSKSNNFSIVFCSMLPPCHYKLVKSIQLPEYIVSIHFPQFKNNEMCSILSQEFVGKMSEDCIKYLMTYAKFKCNDIQNVQKFLEAVWTHVISKLSAFDQNEFTGRKMISFLRTKNADIQRLIKETLTNDAFAKYESNFTYFPEATKFLLIAAYLASTNPPSTDSRYFLTVAKKRKKLSHNVNLDKKESRRIFPLQRLLAIYCYIFDATVGIKDHAKVDSLLMSQIASLCSVRYLQGIPNQQIGDWKYRCLIDEDVAFKLAKSVSMDLEKYLHS